MNNYEDWAQLVAKRLKGEADLIAAIEKDELNDTLYSNRSYRKTSVSAQAASSMLSVTNPSI
jgi:hypothetical protein